MKTLWSTIWAFLLFVCGLVWFAIDGWSGVFKAMLAMAGLGLVIAGILRQRQERKQAGPVVAWPTTEAVLDQVYVYEEPNEEVRLALVRWAEAHPYGEYLEEQESEEEA